MNKYDITVIMPGIKPENWSTIYDDIVGSVGDFSFEFICIGPYDPPNKLLKKENITYIKDFGHPSRCLQRATTFAKGKFMTWGSDDGTFQPMALARCIQFLERKDRKDALTIRYFEQDANPDATPPDQSVLWDAHYHRDLRLPGIREHFKIANIAMYHLDYYREIGGIDCRFEHVNMNCNDLAFRVQEAGGTIFPSPEIVIKQTNVPTKTNGTTPIEDAFHENDYPLFHSIYHSEEGAKNRINIDYDNWKQVPEVWTRRFGEIEIPCIVTRYDKQSDNRGEFWGILNDFNAKEVNYVTTKRGEIRGNHFHSYVTELVFLLKGKMVVEAHDTRVENPEKFVFNLKAGEGIKLKPYFYHTMKYKTNCEQLSILDQAFDPDAPDIHRI